MGHAREWLFRRSDAPGLFDNFIIVTFVLVQILDGILTYKGVSTWGLDIELNPIVGLFMSVLGVALGLVAAKLVGIMAGLIIYWHGFYGFVALLTAIYVAIAILPWTYLFLTI